MTGYKSKRAAAQDKLVVTDIDGHVVRDARKPKKAAAQEPKLQKKDRKRGSIALARSLCYQINGAADDSDDMDGGGYGSVDIAEILSAEVVRLQAALAQPAQEPVAWAVVGDGKFGEYELGQVFVDYKATHTYWENRGYELVPVYTTPLQRPWVDLTEDQIKVIEEMALTKQWAIRMTIAQLKECNT